MTISSLAIVAALCAVLPLGAVTAATTYEFRATAPTISSGNVTVASARAALADILGVFASDLYILKWNVSTKAVVFQFTGSRQYSLQQNFASETAAAMRVQYGLLSWQVVSEPPPSSGDDGEKSLGQRILEGVVPLLLIGAIGGGFYLWRKRRMRQQQQQAQELSAQPATYPYNQNQQPPPGAGAPPYYGAPYSPYYGAPSSPQQHYQQPQVGYPGSSYYSDQRALEVPMVARAPAAPVSAGGGGGGYHPPPYNPAGSHPGGGAPPAMVSNPAAPAAAGGCSAGPAPADDVRPYGAANYYYAPPS